MKVVVLIMMAISIFLNSDISLGEPVSCENVVYTLQSTCEASGKHRLNIERIQEVSIFSCTMPASDKKLPVVYLLGTLKQFENSPHVDRYYNKPKIIGKCRQGDIDYFLVAMLPIKLVDHRGL